ncbi:type II toxin-antitoxin system PemK/MazF family toxin [Actinokineospora auranticolor]|uniref:mRNA-degrading endonuclease toxin of MazEF toxin-antitoxin module n=1 Tax=Actinokineospora auranticolor TaxID=155976 RepID=A0A2S6GHC9_9PSEU|nr:type II toxin-antitoxin system PemK/MazF family toxin [Actinokineospora auranticolor]PPK64634.1 mRNA-degrading endonuclease toxin of MazEF toxin-antitoxin module [Actinokineospora auranticolor]
MSSGSAGTIVRGRVYGADLGGNPGEKYYLAVSNNQRNGALESFLAIRLTTAPKPRLDSIVDLDHRNGPWTGSALADDVVEVYRDEVTRDLGALPPATMNRVNDALKVALGLL